MISTGTMVLSDTLTNDDQPAYMKQFAGNKKSNGSSDQFNTIRNIGQSGNAGGNDDSVFMDYFKTGKFNEMKSSSNVSPNTTDKTKQKENVKQSENIPSGSETFIDSFKSGKNIVVDENLMLSDLREMLSKVNLAHRKERDELDEFYTSRREKLRTIIRRKERK